jgi:hypothetical protein
MHILMNNGLTHAICSGEDGQVEFRDELLYQIDWNGRTSSNTGSDKLTSYRLFVEIIKLT